MNSSLQIAQDEAPWMKGVTVKIWPRGRKNLTLDALRHCLGDDPALRAFESPVTQQVALPAPDVVGSPSAAPSAALSVAPDAESGRKRYPAQVPGQRYLVEYEDFPFTVVTRFEQAITQGLAVDSALGFRRFASEDFSTYAAFMTHWVMSDFVQDQIVINITDLRANTVPWLHWVLGMLTPGVPVDPALLAQVSDRAAAWRAANAAPDLQQFRYHDTALFETLTRLTLRRDVVQAQFLKLMGRPLDEASTLVFQAFADRKSLRNALLNSREYLLRQGRKTETGPHPAAKPEPGSLNAAGQVLSPSEIKLAYQLLLGRGASPQEVMHMVKVGKTAQNLRHAFLNSAEFSQKYSADQTLRHGTQTPAVIHLHIPKSAGTSLTSILAKAFKPGTKYALHPAESDKFRTLTEAQRRKLQLVFGHLEHGVGAMLPQGCIYVCALRQPGPRILSYYRYLKRRTDHPMYALLNKTDMSFGQFLDYAAKDPNGQRLEVDNGQIRRIAGRMTPASLGDEQAVFRTALTHIFAPDMVFGLTEHFGLLLEELVARKLIDGYEPVVANAAPETVNFEAVRDGLTGTQQDLLADLTRWDNKFYSICESYVLGLNADEAQP